MGAVQEVSDTTFPTEVLQSSVPVLVDFWAPWCGPCRQIAPMIEQLSEENKGSFKVVKVNIDENQQYASEYQVEAIPTLIIFKNGQAVERIQAPRPKAMMQQIIDSNKA